MEMPRFEMPNLEMRRFRRKARRGRGPGAWIVLGAGLVIGALAVVGVQNFGKAKRRAEARLRATREKNRLGQPASRSHIRMTSHPAADEPL